MHENHGDERIPGVNAPMTSGQKWSMAGMIAAALLNLALAIAVLFF